MGCSPPGFSVCGILQARILSRLPCPPPEDLPDPVLVGAPEAGAVSFGSLSRGDRNREGSRGSGPEKLRSKAREVDQESYMEWEAGGGESQPLWGIDEEVEPVGVKGGRP